MADRDQDRAASWLAQLCDLFEAEYLPTRRATTREDYSSLMRLYIRPRFGKVTVTALRHAEIAALHREIAKRAPYRANRMLAVLSTMMGLAIKEGWRADNPTRGIERANEEREALSVTDRDQPPRSRAGNASREDLRQRDLAPTADRRPARRGAICDLDQFDTAAGAWTKPSAHTKQKKPHRIPLSAPALTLLADMRHEAVEGCPYVFPSAKVSSQTRHVGGRPGFKPLTEIKRTWASVCKAAGVTDVRLHDLRHSYASVLASSGLSLHIVGALLGHTQPRTTARYAHLYDDALRAATERVGHLVTGAGRSEGEADVVPLPVRAGR